MRIFLLAVALCLTGCAEHVFLNTAPSGATALMNGQPVGQTPFTLNVPRGQLRGDMVVRFEREGYEPLDHHLKLRVGAGRIFGYLATYGILAIFKGPFSIVREPQPIVLAPLSPETPRATTGTSPAFADRLERLQKMRADGTLSEDEYQQLRESAFHREMEKR